MRAIVIREPGGPEVLELREVDAPAPSPGHVLVRVAFAGINRADLMQRQGRYPAPAGVPADIPGLEYAGTIEAVGAGVTRFKSGDRVMGLVGGGAYAELVTAHEREVVPVPAELSLEQAAAVPEAYVTAYDALVVRARLAQGESVLVHAAGSGVGTAGVQIARSLGCLVLGTSRTAEKLERCRRLGLDEAIVPSEGAFASEVRARTAGRGVDVVLELVGGDYVAESLQACAVRGRLVLVGLTGGRKSELDLGRVLANRLEIVGTALRSRPLEEKIEAAKLLELRIAPLLVRGVLRPIIDRVFSLADAAEAHRYVQEDASFGKVLLKLAAG